MTNDEVKAAQRDMAKQMDGFIITSGQQGYGDTIGIDNGRVTLNPYLVAFPVSVQDVSVVIKYCRDKGIKLTTKSGGHSAAGYSLNDDGLVLDLENLSALTPLAHDRLEVGFGTRWINLYNFIEAQLPGLLAIGGGCGRVGVGGFLLGGGFSFASRSYGLASDNIKMLEFVDTDGNIHTLDDGVKKGTKEFDLYWALRGGGGGNFGVVTKAHIQLHRTPTESMTAGQILFPFYRIHEIFDFYNKWTSRPDFPDELAVYGMLRYFPDPRKPGAQILCVSFTPVYNGSFSDFVKLIKPLLDLGPISSSQYSMTLPQWENFVGGSTLVAGKPAYIRSTIMHTGSLTSQVADICQQYMGTAHSNDSYVVWTHLGGQISKNSPNLGAFAHRDGGFAFELKSIWNPDPMSNARTNIEWAVDFFDALQPHSQGAYLNYIDPLLLDWTKQYYGDNYARLCAVKKQWDPKGMLDFQQGIGSSFNTTRPKAGQKLDLSPLTRTHL